MSSFKAVVLCVLICCYGSQCTRELKFPPGFKFGAATAAYQVEGAWNASDKGESIWDRFVHESPERISDGSNGDVACDSYHNWKRDVEIAVEVGVHFYRLSISWPRLLPTGFTNHISEDGKRYYSNLIDELLKNNIEPVVTLYHWDLPQKLQDLGGWTNPLIADWFADYARVAYSLYADRVKTWITINEPIIICDFAYNTGAVAPGLMSPELGNYICNKNTLMAHAKAWRIYDEEFKPKYKGQVSLCNQLLWIEGETEEEEELAELVREYGAGRYSHPIFSKEGGWPPVLEKMIAENSRKQGYSHSRLPAFTQEEINFIRGTYDFYALNHYTSRIVRMPKENEKVESWPLWGVPEFNIVMTGRPDWKFTSSSWFIVYPEGIRYMLRWIKNKYDNVPILITENGYATSYSDLDDYERIQYYRDNLEQVLLAIHKDKVNITGYTAWTLLDNFEWMDGYKSKFGLYNVDFNDPKRTRTPRYSSKYYTAVIKHHALVEPDTLNINNNFYMGLYLFTILFTIICVAMVYFLCRPVIKHRYKCLGFQHTRVETRIPIS